MLRLSGKLALITGSARGMGEAMARLFAGEGATVIVSDVSDKQGEAVAESIGGIYQHLDVASSSDWRAAAEKVETSFGKLDILINNAGIPASKSARFDQMALDEHLRLFDVNMHGAFRGMQTMLPLLQVGGYSSVVNISSIDGLVGVGGLASYVASKHALTGFTRASAIDLGPLGIRVNSIHPGITDTPVVQETSDLRRARLQLVVGRQPIPRRGRPEEVANLALFLASDESSFCTGSSFVVDGGHLAGPYRDPLDTIRL